MKLIANKRDKELSMSERVFLARRRIGISIPEMANRLACSVRRYKAVEYGKEWPWDKVPRVSETNISVLPIHEYYTLLRLRCDITQTKLAEKCGYSRYWLREMEKGRIAYSPKIIQYLVTKCGL